MSRFAAHASKETLAARAMGDPSLCANPAPALRAHAQDKPFEGAVEGDFDCLLDGGSFPDSPLHTCHHMLVGASA
jgi:hypothetical protein